MRKQKGPAECQVDQEQPRVPRDFRRAIDLERGSPTQSARLNPNLVTRFGERQRILLCAPPVRSVRAARERARMPGRRKTDKSRTLLRSQRIPGYIIQVVPSSYQSYVRRSSIAIISTPSPSGHRLHSRTIARALQNRGCFLTSVPMPEDIFAMRGEERCQRSVASSKSSATSASVLLVEAGARVDVLPSAAIK